MVKIDTCGFCIITFCCFLLHHSAAASDTIGSLSYFAIFKAISADTSHVYHFNEDTRKHHDQMNSHHESREFIVVAHLLLSSYQKFVSSQNGDQCTFQPSCSQFSREAFDVADPLQATLTTLDRLTRCHGIYPQVYPTDSVSGKNIDPLSRRILFK
ncbi:MAG: membrane protein insertion efficiency factor YidD [Chitinivibrionales bacterium]|nr:membrane protein insertion efficiency factor YidD [Chitinivibrionales bacterium]